MNEEVLVERKDEREKCYDKIEVLNQVGELLLLPNDEYATMDMVAKYYKVPKSTIDSLVEDNLDELISNGYKVVKGSEIANSHVIQFESFTRNRGNYKFVLDDESLLSVGGHGIRLFSKKAILNVGMLLKDSEVATEIQQKITGFNKINIKTRKEVKFKKILDDSIEAIKKNIRYSHFYEEDYRSDCNLSMYEPINKSIDSILKYKTQYEVCDGKYRIDFYFPRLKIAIEYDEKYHESKEQKTKDKIREYEITKYFYINKNYCHITEEDLKELECKSIEEVFECDYEAGLIDDLDNCIRFIRIKEDNELEGLAYMVSMLSITANSIIDSRGMSCRYDDLID